MFRLAAVVAAIWTALLVPPPRMVAMGEELLPWMTNVQYGEYEANTLDLFRPAGTGPFPAVLYIHGGGWWNGDKSFTSESHIRYFVEHGVMFIPINYRKLPDAHAQGIFPPIEAPLTDARRALSYIQLHGQTLDVDSRRIAVYGSSAGGFNALWLGLSASMAGAGISGVRAIGAMDAQTSIDPMQMREWVGPGLRYGGHAFGLPEQDFDAFLAAREEYADYFPSLSPAALVTAAAPPIFLLYSRGLEDIEDDDLDYVHSPRFGTGFAKLAREKGASVEVVTGASRDSAIEKAFLDFLVESVTR